MYFGVVELDWISYRIAIGNLKTHQTDGKKKVETQPKTI